MNKGSVLFVYLSMFAFFGLYAQNFGPHPEQSKFYFQSEPFYQTTQRDSLSLWHEQLLMHLDSEQYEPKENLFFKAYVLTGPNQLRVSASDVLRVELLDAEGNLVLDQYHRIEAGAANGAVELPKKLKAGKYYLRAYTRWMLNYGVDNLPIKEVTISRPKLKEFEVMDASSIISESGHFVYGLDNKGVISNANGSRINGMIIDDIGKNVSNVVDYGDGLATFNFVPKDGRTYYFEVFGGEKIKLPRPLKEGAMLQVNNIDEKSIKIRIEVTDDLKESVFYLKGSKDGREYLNTKIDFEKKRGHVELDIQKEGLPHGLLNLTLTDVYDQIWAIRPIYNKLNDLQFDLMEDAYIGEDGERRLRYNFKVTDGDGKPISTELSVSVKNVESSVNLLSRIDGERSASFLRDLKVLARRSIENEPTTPEKELPNEIQYTFQNGLEFYGHAYDFNNTLLANKKIQIFINNEDNVEVREVSTNSEGLFTLTGLQFEGEVTLTFRREGKDTKEKLVKVIPYEYELPELRFGENRTLKTPKQIKRSGQLIPQKRLSDFDFKDKPSNLIPLDEVTLVGKKKLGKTTSSVYGVTPTRVVYQDEKRPKELPQLLLDIPGGYVGGMGTINPSFSLPASYGGGPPLWVIDGLPLEQMDGRLLAGNRDDGMYNTTGMSDLSEIMNIVNFLDVERIETLRGVEAGMYGTRAAGGVILIYTKSGAYSADYIARKDAQYTYRGFKQSPLFEEYLRLKKEKPSKEADIATLYWNPSLKTNNDGEALLEVPLQDGMENILIDVKAVTIEGKRGAIKSLSKL